MRRKIMMVITACLMSVSLIGCSSVGEWIHSTMYTGIAAKGYMILELEKRYQKEFVIEAYDKQEPMYAFDYSKVYCGIAYEKGHENEKFTVSFDVYEDEVRDSYVKIMYEAEVREKVENILSDNPSLRRHEIVKYFCMEITNTTDYKSCDEFLKNQKYDVTLETEFVDLPKEQLADEIEKIVVEFSKKNIGVNIRFYYNGKDRYIYSNCKSRTKTKEEIVKELSRE